MIQNSFLRRTVSFAGSAVLLAGLLTGFTPSASGMLSLDARAASYQITAGHSYRVNATSLNIRSGPGFEYPRQGSLPDGALIEVLETRGNWGRIQQGWISLDYLVPTSQISQQSPVTTGYVNASALNVRSGPGVEYAVCGQVTEGYRLSILEVKNGWGRIEDGWVMLKYVNRADSSGSNPVAGYQNITVNDTVKVVAVNLNVRQGPGTDSAKIGSLSNGARVNIREIRGSWGRISGGWISLDYVRPADGTGEESYFSTGGRVQVTADALTVRTGPGVHYQSCGVMTEGYRTTVLEVKNGWGRIENGWISLSYVHWLN